MARMAVFTLLGLAGARLMEQPARPASGGVESKFEEEAASTAAVSPAEERDALPKSELMTLLDKELRAGDARHLMETSYSYSYSYSYMSYSYEPIEDPKTATATIPLKFQMAVTGKTVAELNTPEFVGAVTTAIVSSLADLEVPATAEEIQDVTFALKAARRRSLLEEEEELVVIVSYNFVRSVTEGGGMDLDAITASLLLAVKASIKAAISDDSFGTALAAAAGDLGFVLVVNKDASLALVDLAVVTYVIEDDVAGSSKKSSSSGDDTTVIIIVVVVVVAVVLLGGLAAFFYGKEGQCEAPTSNKETEMTSGLA